MKELNHEDWKKNPTPREMWCWNSSEDKKVKAKVIYILSSGICLYPVLSVTDNDDDYETYKHCTEIEEYRRMTNKELSRWLREKPTREYKFKDDSYIFSYYEYKEGCENEDVSEKIRIREDYGEWKVPLMEIKEE